MLSMALFTGLLAAVLLVSLRAADPLIARPRPTEEILYNPHIGFQTFQHFNGDPLFAGKQWSEVGPEEFGERPASLKNEHHPHTTVAYCRWYWDTIEPRDGQFRWDIIDGALETARDRGQTLAIRVMCHDHFGVNQVPEWFKRTGAKGAPYTTKRDTTYWLPDYSDPLYIKYWTRINEELAARYDGHPDLDTVDCASIGPWGEWSTTPVNPPMAAKAALIDCYTKNFRKTPLLMQFDDAPSMRYGIENGTGWRADCLGDMRVEVGAAWCHMFDSYPQGIIYGGAVDAWRTRPVVFEVCGVMQTWFERGSSADYIFDEAAKWHMSQFNTKSSAVPEAYWPAVERALKRIGFRFGLRKFACTREVRRGAMMAFHTWWENAGCAPIYRGYDLALQLRSSGSAVTIKTVADITTWLPGDTLYDDSVAVPYDLPLGKYALRLAMLDRWTGKPRIALANEGGGEDGWYELGEVEVVATDKRVDRYIDPGSP